MEFGWNQEQLSYRERIQQALKELLPADWDEKFVPESYASDLQIDFSRKFCPELAKRNLLVSHWPKEYGGEGREAWDQFILAEEMKGAGEPRGPQYMNVNWIGPTLMKYGTDEQKHQHLPGLAEGTVIWCQGYSEPNAGTDLAALKTKAVRDGDDYIINGSKIWTSYARKADWCFLLARTGNDRKAISIFMVPMDTPGITVTSYKGLTKDGHLNEMYFTDVRVPAINRVGDEGAAWEIIAYSLNFERVGVPRYHVGIQTLSIAMNQLKVEGRYDDPIIKARAGMILSKFEASRMLTYLVVDQRSKGVAATPDANIARVAALEAVPDLMNFLMEFLPDCLTGANELLEEYYRINVPANITAGTYELQLNLIAKQALALPKG